MAGPPAVAHSRRVRSASSSGPGKRRSNEMTAGGAASKGKGKGKQRAIVQDDENDDEDFSDDDDAEEDAAIPKLVVVSSPPPPPSILVVKGSHTQGKNNSDNGDSSEDVDVDVDAFDAATKRDDGLLAPLLKYLPTGKSMDIPGLRKLLGAVHPSAFGAFKSKEAWRRDNPDVLYAAYAGRHQETCGAAAAAHSPPSNNNKCNAMEDLFDEELDWDKEDEDDDVSDEASVSSLAELGAQTPKETAQPVEGSGPSKLAIYLSKPPEEQKRLARLSSSSPSGLSASSSSASSFSVSGSTSGRLPPHSPTQLGIGPSKLRRQASNSSLATSSSACTCTSAASRSSSISFAALPDTEDLRLHRKSRRGDRSSSMGIAGRRNLLLGKTSSRSDPVLDEEDLFDRLEGLKEEEGFGDLLLDDDDEDVARRKRANESSLRVNEDGELVEKRPLGVTLEDLNLPMKRTKHTRGRPRNTSTDLSTAFIGAPSSPPAGGGRPLLASIHPSDGGSSTGSRSFSSPPTLASSLPLASPRNAVQTASQQQVMAEGVVSGNAVTAASRTLQKYVENARNGDQSTGESMPENRLDSVSTSSRTADTDGNSSEAAHSSHGYDQPVPGSPSPSGHAQSSSSGSDEKTPCSTPRFERLDLAFTSSSRSLDNRIATTTSPPSSADQSFSEITPSATPRCGSPTRGWRMTSTTWGSGSGGGSAGHTGIPEGLIITPAATAAATAATAKDADGQDLSAGASDITVVGCRQRDAQDPDLWPEEDEIDESPLAGACAVHHDGTNTAAVTATATAAATAAAEETDTSPDLVHDLASSPSPSWSSPESPSSDDDQGAYSEIDDEEDRDSLKKERRNSSLVPTLLRGQTGAAGARRTKQMGSTTGVRVHTKKMKSRAPSFGRANATRTGRAELA